MQIFHSFESCERLVTRYKPPILKAGTKIIAFQLLNHNQCDKRMIGRFVFVKKKTNKICVNAHDRSQWNPIILNLDSSHEFHRLLLYFCFNVIRNN